MKSIVFGSVALGSVALLGVVPALAGELSGEFVRLARAAYPADPMCRTTLVTNWPGSAVANEDLTSDVVRWVRAPGVRNLRDIGGWTGLPEGRVYRGTQVGTAKYAPYREVLGEEGRRVLQDTLGIRTDLDLRGDGERARDGTSGTPDVSPIGPKVRRINAGVDSYLNIFGYQSPEKMGAALRVFADAKNYPVFVHCMGGADRTGTLCFLLETLCGVPLADATIDYELTTCSPVGLRRRDGERHPAFAMVVRALASLPGATFADKVAYWAEKIAGLTPAEIAAIRGNLKGTGDRFKR